MPHTYAAALYQRSLPILLALAAVVFSLSLAAQGSPPPSLADQLRQDYKQAKFNVVNGAAVLLQSGTVVVILKPGLIGVPPGNAVAPAAAWRDNEMHGPSGSLLFAGNVTKPITAGERMYVVETDVNLKKDKISFLLAECDVCNSGATATYKAILGFQFPKGYLQGAQLDQVEAVVQQVLQIDPNGDQPPQNTQAQSANDQNQQPPADQPPPEPVQIVQGQTIDEVKAALGNPEKIVTVGTKQIYVYKDLKITFINGKVTDVQ
jgi:hypothetical protein